MQLEDVLMRLKIIIKPVPTIGMGAPHPYCRINCEKLVVGWQQSHSSILL